VAQEGWWRTRELEGLRDLVCEMTVRSWPDVLSINGLTRWDVSSVGWSRLPAANRFCLFVGMLHYDALLVLD